MKDLIKFYVLQIPLRLYVIGAVFFVLLLVIQQMFMREIKKRQQIEEVREGADVGDRDDQ